MDQLSGLPAPHLSAAFRFWALGVTLAASGWVFAAMAASAYANGRRTVERLVGWLGYAAVIGSLACFAMGALNVAAALDATGAR